MATDAPGDNTLVGRIIGSAGRTEIENVIVWFAYRSAGGEPETVTTTSDADGSFEFDLPTGPVETARVGTHLEGSIAVDLEANGTSLEPGEVVVMVDDFAPSHNRYLYG
jgi:hypothetical protein